MCTKIRRIAFCVSKNAHGRGGLVLKVGQHPVDTLRTHFVDEPLDVGPWQSTKGIQAQGRVLNNHGSPYSLGGLPVAHNGLCLDLTPLDVGYLISAILI